MDIQEELRIIEMLRDDKHYFGELGRKYLSNSDITTIIKDPSQYGLPWSNSSFFLQGKYIHYKVLQPELFEDGKSPMLIIDANTRNTKVYKEAVDAFSVEGEEKPIFLLKKEALEMDYFVQKIISVEDFRVALRGDKTPHDAEEPAIGEIFGYNFKGKADKINRTEGFIADLKTTKSLSSFTSNFKTYGYHTQAYIYRELFGMPVRFYVICKDTGKLGIFDVSEETLEEAETQVLMGIEKMEMYFGSEAEHNIDEYYEYAVL